MARNGMGLLDLNDDEQQQLLNDALIRGGLATVIGSHGTGGRFAPQAAQGLLSGFDTYQAGKQQMMQNKYKLAEAKRLQDARDAQANVFDAQGAASPGVAPPMPRQGMGLLGSTSPEMAKPEMMPSPMMHSPAQAIPYRPDAMQDQAPGFTPMPMEHDPAMPMQSDEQVAAAANAGTAKLVNAQVLQMQNPAQGLLNMPNHGATPGINPMADSQPRGLLGGQPNAQLQRNGQPSARERALIAYYRGAVQQGDLAGAKFAMETLTKEKEGYSLSAGQTRFDANNRQVASGAKDDFTLGDTRFSGAGDIIVSGEAKAPPKVAEINAILAARNIYPGSPAYDATFASLQNKETTHTPPTQVNVDTKGSNAFATELYKGQAEGFAKRQEAAKSASDAIPFLHEARQLLDNGIISGSFANWKLQLQKAFGTEKAANTETYISTMGRQVIGLVKQVGGTQISNSDREFAEKMAGGNINLNEESMRKIIDIGERASRAIIKQHNEQASQVEQSQYGAQLPFSLQVRVPPDYRGGVKSQTTGHSNMGTAPGFHAPEGAPPGTKFHMYSKETGNRVWKFPDGSLQEEY